MNTLQSINEQPNNKTYPDQVASIYNIIIPDQVTFNRLKIIPFITTFYDVIDEMLLD